MAVTITYFVHGTTTDNERGISSGWSDVDLSELGVKQSIELPKQIGGKKFDVVFCSDLKRAVHSAELSFKDVYPIIPDARLRECNYGAFNGKPTELVDPMKEKSFSEQFPDGESYEDVKKRIADFLEFLRKSYDGKRVAIVSHEGPQLALEVLLKGKVWEQAFGENWRNTKSWRPGWEYVVQ